MPHETPQQAADRQSMEAVQRLADQQANERGALARLLGDARDPVSGVGLGERRAGPRDDEANPATADDLAGGQDKVDAPALGIAEAFLAAGHGALNVPLASPLRDAPVRAATFDPEHVFRYHAPTAEQVARYARIREAAKVLAYTILADTPASADQSAALRLVREAVMTANAAVALNGRLY
jgi:hypothetical protein